MNSVQRIYPHQWCIRIIYQQVLKTTHCIISIHSNLLTTALLNTIANFLCGTILTWCPLNSRFTHCHHYDGYCIGYDENIHKATPMWISHFKMDFRSILKICDESMETCYHKPTEHAGRRSGLKKHHLQLPILVRRQSIASFWQIGAESRILHRNTDI